MRKQTKMPALIPFILILAFLGSCAGVFALSRYRVDRLPEGTYVSGIGIGGMNYLEAKERLTDYNDFLMDKGRLVLSVGEERHVISYESIDARIDVEKTLDAVFAILSGNALNSLVAGGNPRNEYESRVSYNEGKLSSETERIFGQYSRDPEPPSYRIEDGKLIYSPGASGIRVDYSALGERIAGHLATLNQEELVISLDDPEIFTEVFPDTGDGTVKFRVIVSESHVSLGDTGVEAEDEIPESLDGIVVRPGEMLALSDILDFGLLSSEGRQDMVNRVATAVYQAFLPIKGIKPANRRPSDTALPYSEPGLEAVIRGEDGDLVLENATDQPLMLLCEIKDRNLHCYVIAPQDVPSGVLAAVKKEVVDPPVIYTVSSDLKKGESRVVSEGRQGFTVQVERIIGNERETLYIDRYHPVSRVVEVGENPLQTGMK